MATGCELKMKYAEDVHDDGSVDFYVFADGVEKEISLNDVKKIEKAKYKTFDEFAKKAINTVWKVSFPKTIGDWYEATCSCPSFCKNYMCKHIISIARELDVIVDPKPNYHNKALFGKPKKGKPKKASKKPLEYDD